MKRNVELSAQNTKILVCCHKACTLPPDEEGLLLPIHCGAALSDVDLKMQRDDEVLGQPCDNISLKNGIYNELTGTYWAWKNIKKLYPDLEYIGLCHYRRYFNFAKKGPFFRQEQWYISEDRLKSLDCGLGALKKLMSGCDVILPVARSMPFHMLLAHLYVFGNLDYAILEAVILKLHPEYRKSLTHIFYESDDVPQRNMFIMKWELFEQYCKWLFGIFFEVEKIIKLSPYNLPKRIFAYMGEIPLALFCFHNNFSVKRRQIFFVNEAKNPIFLETMCKYLFNKLRFKLNISPPYGGKLISEKESTEATFKSEGVWDAIERLGPVAPSPTH